MSVVAHITTLEHKHNQIENKIAKAYAHHMPDAELVALKKQKLRLKEEIVNFRSQYEAA